MTGPYRPNERYFIPAGEMMRLNTKERCDMIA